LTWFNKLTTNKRTMQPLLESSIWQTRRDISLHHGLVSVEDFFEGRKQIVINNDVPAHILGDATAIFNHGGEFGVGLGQEHQDFICDFATFGDFNPVAGGPINSKKVFDLRELAIDGGVISDDDVSSAIFRGGFCSDDGVTDEAGTAGDVCEDAEAAEGERFDEGDAEWFVDALAEFDVGSPVDIDDFHIFGHFVAAEFSAEAELVDEDDFYVFAFGVKFLNGGVEGCLASGEVGPALAVRDGPVVTSFHFENVAASSLADLGGEHIHYSGFTSTGECVIEVFEDAEVSPESFTADQAGNVGEDEVGRVAEEVEAVLLEFAFGVEFFLEGGFVGVNAVINDADVFGFKFRREEPQLIGDEAADGEDGVAMFGGIDERVFEVLVLRAEDILDVEFLLVRFFDYVVKHCVVARVVLDDFSHCGDFVCVEDGFVIAGPVEHGGHRGGHTHILVRDDDGFVCCCADDFEDSEGGGRETDILFEVPEVFVKVAFDVELFKQSGF